MTVMGHHTAAELADLVAARDHAHKELSLAFEHLRGDWAKADARSFAAFSDDYEAQSHRYQEARERANAAITIARASLVPMNAYPVEDEWTALLAAERRDVDMISPGDFDDLYDRLSVLAHAVDKPMPSAGPMPQQSGSNDLEQSFLVATEPVNEAVEAVEEALRRATDIVDSQIRLPTPLEMALGVAAVGALGLVVVRVATAPLR